MRAEVIAIGDELTSGQRLDTNSQWISRRLEELGIPVAYHSTVGDELADNERVFRAAVERAEVVVSTGGLGPTADDLTRPALAAVVAEPLVLDGAALAHIESLFVRRGRTMPESNRVQAMVPRGGRLLANPHGTAPGVHLLVPRPGGGVTNLFALPGVPAELREMWPFVASVLAALAGDRRRVIMHRKLQCFGVGESELEQMLPDLIRRGRQPRVGITVSQATISLRITAEGATAAECQAAIDPVAATIRGCLGELVFGEGQEQLEDVVLRRLRERRETLAVAERGADGLLAHWLARAARDVPGVFRGALVHVGQAAIEEAGAVELAAEARARFDATLGLALVTPPAAGEAPPPRSLLALSAAGGQTWTATAAYSGHPDILRPRAVKQALDFLRRAEIPSRSAPGVIQ